MIRFCKTGTVLFSGSGTYQVVETRSYSENCVVVRCTDRSGRTLRVHLYQEGAPATGEVRQKYLRFQPPTGWLQRLDSGIWEGLPFDVYPETGQPLSEYVIGMTELVSNVIPCIAYGIEAAHQAGILVRDIRPQGILYDPAKGRAFLSAAENLCAIDGGATATFAAARGLSASLEPPEYRKLGWSVYSDYYAFGMAVLDIIEGYRIFGSGKDAKRIDPHTAIRQDEQEILQRQAYETLTVQQRIRYLILGLTMPDPQLRWSYAEVRCWCAGQSIPLVRPQSAFRYQTETPFYVDGKPYWDPKPLADALASTKTPPEKLLPELTRHLLRCLPKEGKALQQVLSDGRIAPDGAMFRAIYILDPQKSGLWWAGRLFANTAELAQYAGRSSRNTAALGRLLSEGCLSYLARLRSSPEQTCGRYALLEQWERDETGKGAFRFMMWMGDGVYRSFSCLGREFHSADELISYAEKSGSALRERAVSLLADPRFRAWLWISGIPDAVLDEKGAEQNPFSAYGVLLLLLERLCTANQKRLCRRLYLRWGSNAPITWLRASLNLYHYTGIGVNGCFYQLQTANWSEAYPIEKLDHTAQELWGVYQQFVGFVMEANGMIRPCDSTARFTESWNGAEVTPAFLAWMQEKS